MFFTRRNPRPESGRRPPRRVPFRPILEALEERVTPTGSITVTNLADTGADTLRDAVAQADANTSGVFTINLVGGTYTLSQNSPLLLNNTNAGTTIVIQGSTETGNPTILNETALSRVLQVSSGTSVRIANVTVEHGSATDAPTNATGFNVVGGGLLNDGGSVTLVNDVFQSNLAEAGLGTAGVAGGGGIFSVGGTLTLDTVTLSHNVAQGGSGQALTHTHGGNAFGGGLGEINTTVIVTDLPVTDPSLAPPPVPFDPSTLARPLLTVSSNFAQGGDGASGRSGGTRPSSLAGADGGFSDGGGLWLGGGTVSIAAASITSNMARGGFGGAGNSSALSASLGTGGDGGEALGGGLSAEKNTQLTLQDSTIASNTAQGGVGGAGGNGTAANTPGAQGGAGGIGDGGGLEIAGSDAGFRAQILNSTVAGNQADGGDGGRGGNSASPVGGVGGDSGPADGAGVLVAPTFLSPVSLINVTVAFNVVDASGDQPGRGGTNSQGGTASSGVLVPGDGGGVDSLVPTTMPILINSVVALNTLSGGASTNDSPDVAGVLSESTRFSYFGNPSGDNNLFTSDVLFNSVTHTPGNSNAYGGFHDAQGNLVPADPLFASTQPVNNGGPTGTIELQSDSYLIGKGTASITGSAIDQRGVSRGDRIDLGAVEFSGTPSPPPAPPGSPPPPPSSPPGSPPSPPPPSLISAIIGLYIAEVEKDIGFGDPVALQQTIDFDARFTVIFGINIAPFIEMIADTNVANARGGDM